MAKQTEEQRLRHKEYRQKDPEKWRKYRQEYYLRNRDKMREQKKKYYLANLEVNRAKRREANRKRPGSMRAKVVVALGSKCVLCGFSHPSALHIDHVRGGGTKERTEFKTLQNYYKYVLENVETGHYQVICANCHSIKHNRPILVRSH